jgi:2-polyprenyl-6-hydroxyphenyl methylase / 3-demethylubiquinone-9 3-methyltransferase
MTEAVDYFSNHSLKLRFPWRLYHAPIVGALANAIRWSPGAEVLNVGAGPFFELSKVALAGRRFTICDIDPRAIELAHACHGSALARADVIRAAEALPYDNDAFDLVVSMDVIEHVPDPLPWLRELVRVLAPGGQLFLTTPNYASYSLRAIENTALEAIARVQGFSRQNLHISKMTSARLSSLLAQAGAGNTHIRKIAFGWVLCSESTKPR